MERQSRRRSGVALQRGDIVLVPFPFTDLSSQKLRPAVIVSVDPQEDDLVVAFISSVVAPVGIRETDYLLHEDDPAFEQTGLKKASVFRMRKLLTIERTRIVRRLGRLSPSLQKELDARLKHGLGL